MPTNVLVHFTDMHVLPFRCERPMQRPKLRPRMISAWHLILEGGSLTRRASVSNSNFYPKHDRRLTGEQTTPLYYCRPNCIGNVPMKSCNVPRDFSSFAAYTWKPLASIACRTRYRVCFITRRSQVQHRKQPCGTTCFRSLVSDQRNCKNVKRRKRLFCPAQHPHALQLSRQHQSTAQITLNYASNEGEASTPYARLLRS